MQNEPKPGDILRDRFTAKEYTVSDIVTLGDMPLMLVDWYGFDGSTARYGRRSKAIEILNWSEHWEIVEPASLNQNRSETGAEYPTEAARAYFFPEESHA